MDADALFEALSPDENGISPSEIAVEFSSDFDRLTDPEIEAVIARTWDDRLRENPRLFNGKKFRLHRLLSDGQKPKFQLGLTTYREYLGTNCCREAEELRTKGMALTGDPQAYMSQALGVGALLITSDEKFVFLRRSQVCGESAGLIDGPGGHAEPEKVPAIFSDPAKVETRLIVEEIFDSILREVVDEVNIPKSKLSEPRLLGIVKNNETGGRISAEFVIRCQLSSSEILDSFDLGTQAEAYESTAIYFLPEEELTKVVAPPSDYTSQARELVRLHFYLKNLKTNLKND